MQILRIEPFDSLRAHEVSAVRSLVAELPDGIDGVETWLNQDLVVYVTSDREADGRHRRIVAPRSPAIRPGAWVSAVGWTAATIQGTADTEHVEPSIHAAGSLATAPPPGGPDER